MDDGDDPDACRLAGCRKVGCLRSEGQHDASVASVLGPRLDRCPVPAEEAGVGLDHLLEPRGGLVEDGLPAEARGGCRGRRVWSGFLLIVVVLRARRRGRAGGGRVRRRGGRGLVGADLLDASVQGGLHLLEGAALGDEFVELTVLARFLGGTVRLVDGLRGGLRLLAEHRSNLLRGEGTEVERGILVLRACTQDESRGDEGGNQPSVVWAALHGATSFLKRGW